MLAAFFLLFVMACPGICGYYAVTFTGGSITDDGSSSKQFQQIDPETDFGFANVGTGGSESVKGPLTARFKWNPAYQNEPPPAHVLLMEEVYTEWQSDVFAGSCTDGYTADNESDNIGSNGLADGMDHCQARWGSACQGEPRLSTATMRSSNRLITATMASWWALPLALRRA